MNRFPCGNCGGKIGVPAGHAKAKIRCSHCGYYAEVPAAMRAAAAEDPDTAPVKASSPTATASPTPKAPKPKAPAPAVVEDAYTAAKLRAAPAPEEDDVPAAKPATKPKARARPDANDTRPEFLIEDTGPPMLEGTQDEDEDDVRPYAVPGTGLKKCPHCDGELPLDATFCVNCGEHLTEGREAARGKGKRKRTYEPMSGAWTEGWSWETRLAIIVGLQVTNLLLIMLFMTVNGQSLSSGEAWTTNLTVNLFNIFLQVFIVGSYEGFTFERTEAGKTTMWRHRRIAFAKLAPQKVAWKKATGVGVLGTHDPGMTSWFIFGYLFLCGIVPGVVFYFLVIRPERFSPALCDEYRSVQEVLLRTKDREMAGTIAKMLSNATGLRYHQVL